MSLSLISKSEYNVFYQPYIDAMTDIDLLEGLKLSGEAVNSFLLSIPAEKHGYAYAEGKWTVKDVLLHIIDTERIFAYRALRIARGDKAPLAGFEQDDYVLKAGANTRSFENLLKEYNAVRQTTMLLYESFDAETLLNIGKASGFPVSVRAIGYIICGHEKHHIKIIKERYL